MTCIGDEDMPVDVTFDDTFSGLLRYYYRKKHVKQRILTLPLSLDFGNIKTANIVRTRASFLEELSRNTHGYSVKEEIQKIRDNLSFLEVLIESGTSFRIWWTNKAADYCGFIWLCDRLKTVENEVEQIKVPTLFPRENQTLLEINEGLSGLSCDLIDEFKLFERQQKLSASIRRDYSYMWQELQEENQPIRVLINDHLLSQPVTFYDKFIYQQTSKTDFTELDRLLGKIVLHYGVGILEGWYWYRIEKLIDEEKLEAKQSKIPMKQLIRLRK
ncbi:DUF3658 domain-containing protein [Lentilactobacillus hilgardii]|nr:DUF3658 domain-containing protein [Lentilactobacillus hilgardii]